MEDDGADESCVAHTNQRTVSERFYRDHGDTASKYPSKYPIYTIYHYTNWDHFYLIFGLIFFSSGLMFRPTSRKVLAAPWQQCKPAEYEEKKNLK